MADSIRKSDGSARANTACNGEFSNYVVSSTSSYGCSVSSAIRWGFFFTTSWMGIGMGSCTSHATTTACWNPWRSAQPQNASTTCRHAAASDFNATIIQVIGVCVDSSSSSSQC